MVSLPARHYALLCRPKNKYRKVPLTLNPHRAGNHWGLYATGTEARMHILLEAQGRVLVAGMNGQPPASLLAAWDFKIVPWA